MILIKEDQVSPFLNKMASRLKNTEPLMGKLSQEMVNAVKENFLTEGQSLLGRKWQPLKPATLKSKQKRNRPLSILQDSSDLISSIYGKHTGKEAMAGISVKFDYAAIHQFGGEIYHHPLTRTMRFRLDKKGGLMSQKDHPNLVRFAGKKHKNQVNYTMTQKAYTTIMPARPYLGLGPTHKKAALATIKKFILEGK